MHGSGLSGVIYILMDSSPFGKRMSFGGVTGVGRGLAIGIIPRLGRGSSRRLKSTVYFAQSYASRHAFPLLLL